MTGKRKSPSIGALYLLSPYDLPRLGQRGGPRKDYMGLKEAPIYSLAGRASLLWAGRGVANPRHSGAQPAPAGIKPGAAVCALQPIQIKARALAGNKSALP